MVEIMEESEFTYNINLTKNENLCDFIMSEYGQVGRLLSALYSIDHLNNGNIHIVKYEDILYNPQKTMDGIYDFLKIDRFNHNFTNIKKVDQENDDIVGHPKNLHKIRQKLGKGNVRVEEYLTSRSIEKYKDYRYF
jgi:hypothetical protein